MAPPTTPSGALAVTNQNATPSAAYGAGHQYTAPVPFTPYGAGNPYAAPAVISSFGAAPQFVASLSANEAVFQHSVQQSVHSNAVAMDYEAAYARGEPMTLQFTGYDSAETFDFNNEDHNVKKLQKAVVYSAMVAIMTAIGTHSQLAVASPASTKTLINLATANAKDLCGQINYSGSDVSGAIKIAANAKLPLMLKKIGINAEAGADASVEIAAGHYSGPARKDLPVVISSELQCRKDAEHYLLDAMKQELNSSDQSPSQTNNVSVKTGDVHQEQSQQVNVNNTPVQIPSFTIQEQPFSSSYEVTPHTSANTESQPPPPVMQGQTDSLRCADFGQIKPGAKSTFELIENLPRCVEIGAGIVFLGESDEHGHKRAIFQSTDLWNSSNTVASPYSPQTFLYAYALVEKGEPIYISSGGVEYSLSADESRQPSDGSDTRIAITISRPVSTN
jgi:hypothetical protein